MSKQVDLTTLPGWGALSDGSHNITIVAKAGGYADSEPSASVSVTKGPEEEDPLVGTWVFNDRPAGVSTAADVETFSNIEIRYIDPITHEICFASDLTINGANLPFIASLNIGGEEVYSVEVWTNNMWKVIQILSVDGLYGNTKEKLLQMLKSIAIKVDELYGTWIFNDTLVGTFTSVPDSATHGQINIDYASKEIAYNVLERNFSVSEDIDELFYINDEGGVMAYSSGEWNDETFKTVDVRSTSIDAMMSMYEYAYTFFRWFSENATKQG